MYRHDIAWDGNGMFVVYGPMWMNTGDWETSMTVVSMWMIPGTWTED
jgi:hypothetical protein